MKFISYLTAKGLHGDQEEADGPHGFVSPMCPKPVGTCRDPKHTEGYQEYT
jgi:hypothetical protein